MQKAAGKLAAIFDCEINALNMIYIIISLATCAMMLIYYIFGAISSMAIRPLFLMAMMFAGFYPQKGDKTWVVVLDIVFIVLSAVTNLYFLYNEVDMMYSFGKLPTIDIVMGLMLILLLCEASRRKLGIVMPVVALAFILYAYFGHFISGTYHIHEITVSRLVSTIYSTTGIYGTCHGVMLNVVFAFLIFGAFLGATGSGDFFVSFAKALCGKSVGGPAKIAVVSSMLFGSISGSCVSNVVATGSFTIPMMKNLGYKSEFAGAVEAAASTGGQIMPPVMGASAFLIAEMCGLPLSRIILISFIPAILYYISIFLGVHYEAKKLALSGLSAEDLPKMLPLLKKDGILALPLLLLIVLLVTVDFTVDFIVLFVIAIMIIISVCRNKGIARYDFIFRGLISAFKSSVPTALVCALAGVIVSMVTVTSLSYNFSVTLSNFTGESMLLSLIMVLLVGLILGMGLPTISAFILMSSVCGAGLIQLGLPTINTYMIMFWFSIISNVTPPVCLAAYAAAGIAQSKPFKTGLVAFRLSLPLVFIPFMMAYRQILLEGTPFETISTVFSCAIAVFCFAILLTGFFKIKLSVTEMALCLIGGICAYIPGLAYDAIGLACTALMIISQLLRYKSAKKQSCASRRNVI